MSITLSAPTYWALAWAVAGAAFVLVVILAHRVLAMLRAGANTVAWERAAADAWLNTKRRGGQ